MTSSLKATPLHDDSGDLELLDQLAVARAALNEQIGRRIIGQREVVVRALTDPFIRVEGISGATELGDGHAVLTLDVPALLAQPRVM